MLLKLGSILFALPAVLLIFLYNSDLNIINECQEMGQYFHAEKNACVDDKQPVTSYYQRHAALVNASMLIALLGGALLTWGMILKGLARAPEDRPN